MTTGITASPNLRAAFHKANEIIFDKEYIVVAANKTTNPKEPVILQLKYPDGKTRNIGIIHLAHLRGEDWDNKPFSEVARTTEEVVDAILGRIALFFEAQKHPFYIDQNGTIFHFNQTTVKLDKDNTFFANDKLVTYSKKPLELTKIKSEGIVTFRQLENGHIELYDKIDQRKGKGIYIDTEGAIYRA